MPADSCLAPASSQSSDTQESAWYNPRCKLCFCDKGAVGGTSQCLFSVEKMFLPTGFPGNGFMITFLGVCLWWQLIRVFFFVVVCFFWRVLKGFWGKYFHHEFIKMHSDILYYVSEAKKSWQAHNWSLKFCSVSITTLACRYFVDTLTLSSWARIDPVWPEVPSAHRHTHMLHPSFNSVWLNAVLWIQL